MASCGREGATAPDEEDTLHPEDGVAAITQEAIAAASAQAEPEVGTSAPQAGLGRRLLALSVIVALIVVIVVLVWWGLAR